MTEFIPRAGDVIVLPVEHGLWDPRQLYQILNVAGVEKLETGTTVGAVTYESYLAEDRARESTPYCDDLTSLHRWGMRPATEQEKAEGCASPATNT
jgi:hypothetical protein